MKSAQKSIPKIPDGMVELMKNLVKSVLKEQPENIYLFAAEYFENLILKRDGTLDKEYSVFRKYEEELERRRIKEGCSRCRRLVNVEGNADDDLSKQAEDEHSLDMSVSGVAIKAVPRHYKPVKTQKSKHQLETIRSESMDSAIENGGKSTSAKSNAVVQQISMKSTETPSAAASFRPTIEENEEQTVSMEKIPTEKIIQPLIEEIIEPISARKLMGDEDVPPDTPTNEISISDANTGQTVIENAVSTLTIDNQNDDLNPIEIGTEKNNSTDNIPTDTSTEVQLLTESPKSELLHLQKSDRIQTPESDSGLSEKSFNLNIHEETTANETYKAEPIKEEDFIEEELIPLNTSRGTVMEKEEDEKMDDEQMNRTDVEQLKNDSNASEQIHSDEKDNENIEERKKEIERVRSREVQKPTNDQPLLDPQQMIADDISEQIKDPNNLVSKEYSLENTESTGIASSEQHERLQIATENCFKGEPLAESNDLEKKKTEEEPPNPIEKSTTIENDQTADSTEKSVIQIENKADEPISTKEETDSISNELKLIEENEELPKTTENEINNLQTKTSSDIEEIIEFNEQKPTDAILEKDSSEINETFIEKSENCSENSKVNKSTEGKPTAFEETTDSQPIVDESNENSNEKTENDSDGVELAESNKKEPTIAESYLNDIESSNVIRDMGNIDVLSEEESGETKSSDPLHEKLISEDQVDSKWETTTDAIAQKVREQDENQIELRKNRLMEDQNPKSIQDLEPTNSIANNSKESHEKINSDDLKPNQPSEEADIMIKGSDGLNGKDLVNDDENINEKQPLDSEGTIISNELEDVKRDIDDIQDTNSSKKDEFNVTEGVIEAIEKHSKKPISSPKAPKTHSNESSLEAGDHAQLECVRTSAKVQSNESALEIGEEPSEQLNSPPTTPKVQCSKSETNEQVQPKSIPTSPKAQSDEWALEKNEQAHSKSPPISPRPQVNESESQMAEKHSEQLNSLPTTPKAESNESDTVKQLQPKSIPSSPITEVNSMEPTLDDQKLSGETTTSNENEPTDRNKTTIIEKNLKSTTIKNKELSITNENQTEDANISIKSTNRQDPTTEDPKTNVNEIETTHSEIKNNNDDAISEKSSSVKDDLYEKAETEIFGDESVQDLDLSMQEIEQTEDVSKEDLTGPNITKKQTDSPQQQDSNKNENQIQPDSLDNSLEPIGENDSLVDIKSVDSLEVEKKDAKSDKFDVTTRDLGANEEDAESIRIDQDSAQNKSAKTDDKLKAEEGNAGTSTSLVESKPGSSSQDLMGDSVNDKGNYDHMNDQMQNELATLNFSQNVTPIQLSNIEEVDTPVTAKSAGSEIKFVYESEVKVQDDVKPDVLKKEIKENPHIMIETESKELTTTKSDGEVIPQTQHENQENPKKYNSDTKSHINVKFVDYLTSLRHISHDTPSSDLSDTDTEKPELVSNESCIDENSRDERDDVSEVENFDLSSYGEDSLEAMYYMLRKNEILMDEQKKMNKCEDEKITFPEKATENLENVFREVSGKKTIFSVGSMNSSTDDVILKQISSDSDALQMHVLPNSEIDSSTEPKSCAMNTTDDEYLTEKNDISSRGMVHDEMDSKRKQNNNSLMNDEQPDNECDTFDDDVIQANIARNIQAYSISEADSDEAPANTKFLTKDDFNVSTALGHLRSTTDESDSFESAATKIQAGARGFLTRRRLGRSEANASASIEKRSSIGNAAIDKSLDNFVDRQELMQDQGRTKIDNGDLKLILTIDQTNESIDDDASVQELIEVKMEQKKSAPSTSIIINENITENPTLTETELKEAGSDDSGAAQRRLTLQRGDAMQRNSTPELEQPQHLIDKEKIDNKEPSNDEAPASPKHDEATKRVHKPVNSASKLPTGKPMKTLGPRQRSMPVQFESMLMRVLPIPEQKRIKSAKNSTPKKKKRRPNLF